MNMRIRKARGGHNRRQGGNSGGWEIVYTGFILILLCFFIMLTSFASLKQSKITRFARSFSAAVSVLGGGISFEEGETVLFNPGQLVHKEDELARLFQKIRLLSASVGLDPDLVTVTERGVVLTLAGAVVFDLGRATISPGAAGVLDKVAALIKQVPMHVRIEGHTDDLPVRSGRYPSNWELSTARATNVLRYLIKRHGIAPSRLSAVGFAQYHPLVPNDGSAGRARNRRVEFVFDINLRTPSDRSRDAQKTGTNRAA